MGLLYWRDPFFVFMALMLRFNRRGAWGELGEDSVVEAFKKTPDTRLGYTFGHCLGEFVHGKGDWIRMLNVSVAIIGQSGFLEGFGYQLINAIDQSSHFVTDLELDRLDC